MKLRYLMILLARIIRRIAANSLAAVRKSASAYYHAITLVETAD